MSLVNATTGETSAEYVQRIEREAGPGLRYIADRLYKLAGGTGTRPNGWHIDQAHELVIGYLEAEVAGGGNPGATFSAHFAGKVTEAQQALAEATAALERLTGSSENQGASSGA